MPQELENVDYLSGSDAEDSDIDESDDEDALEINNDEIGIPHFTKTVYSYNIIFLLLFYFILDIMFY